MALPSQIDPRKLALQGTKLEGQIDASNLTRLSSAVADICGSVNASIAFEIDESRQPIVRGTLSVSVDVICQRCLDTMAMDLQAQFALQVIWSEDQIANVAPNYEPWIVVDKAADLIPVIEDELLLALPIVNYHKPGDCTGNALQQNEAVNEEEAIADNPFSVLQQLKK